MSRTLLVSLLALAMTACDPVPVSTDDPADPTGSDGSDTSAATADTGGGPLAPEDYTLSVEAGATTTSWKYGAGSISALLCATITEEGGARTLRVYPTTVTAEYAPYCEDSGAFPHSALRFSGRYIQTPGEGWVTIEESSTGAIVSGYTRFDDDQVGEIVVDIMNRKDPSIAPARMRLTAQTTSSELTFTFTKEE